MSDELPIDQQPDSAGGAVERSNVARRALVLPTLPANEINPAAVYLARLSPGSRRTMRSALNLISSEFLGVPTLLRPVVHQTKYGPRERTEDWTCLRCNWAALDYQHTAAIRAQLQQRYEATTANRHLAALFGVLREARNLGLMSSEHYDRARNLKPIRGHTAAAGRALATDEIERLLSVCLADTRPIGVRDTALVVVLYSTGCRRSEVAGIDVTHYNASTGELLIKKGKGNKDRTCYIPERLRTFLDQWLAVRGDLPGALFGSFTKSGNMTTGINAQNGQATIPALTDRAIFFILDKRRKEAGLDHFSPHDLRRTLITTLLDRNVDIGTVSKIVGHSDVQTTLRYDRRGEKAKQRAVDQLPIPDVASRDISAGD